ncbi:transcription antitermination factor NusB [Denitromonas ohlonensis]|jgi:N utilization substance protein B|uniref:Transcription antitermination protein NusB n=2 Tax=Denitromonas TaxID=139331 RepID=A0A558CF18_9RHOO|nr:transcription antitermination factor NusB [Denitromonas ohlonensis]TVT47367.1 MAG: transcription antitermination factor NusB [Denitromonas halophila]TVO64936.1 transcription antitermination factor NusB [Denitromonas ohlonensis]TVO75609.1 transcription antitermination factor NusB [Denitromonas ohlonensis]TVT71719.1 MAG: transcription antitermination factor NusB [Denitromonas halophila]TVT78731.1 MAG: transcription antitermination factor NusB [Denitromonas halophila]
MSSKSARRRAREFALQGIYQALLSGNSLAMIEDQMRSTPSFDKADGELFTTLLRGTLNDTAALEAEFAPFIGRTVTELSPIERAVLLLATHELERHIEVPYKVVINEAIELAKSYGGTDGHRFVNGVMDKVAAKLRPTEFAAREAARKGD